MNAGAGSGAMGRFALLQGDSESPQQAFEDALALTGLPIDIDVVDSPNLPIDVPMTYSLFDHHIEINTNYPVKLTRAKAAQYMAEELLHATDHLGKGYTLSAGSSRMSFLYGDIFKEVLQHYINYGYFKEFFDYPLHHTFEYIFTQDRIRAELFARLGVLYFAEPDTLKIELPLAYEVFHECFNLSKSSPIGSEYVRGKIWRISSSRNNENRSRSLEIPSIRRNITKSDKQQSTNRGLERLRYLLAQCLDSPSNGRKAKL